MTKERRNKILSGILLAVYVSMQLLVSFHFHELSQSYVPCEQCIQHIPHNGHISAYNFSGHDCVVCQFAGNLYPLASVLSVLPALLCLTYIVVKRHSGNYSHDAFNAKLLRAPPVCSVN
jgi:hypothetical protein